MWTWFSGPFGTDAPNTNPQGVGTFTYDLRFPGQIGGAWGSTYQNDHRDYDPAVGKYVESDPLGLYGGSYSTYAYVRENPLSNVDPFGLCPKCAKPPELPNGATVKANIQLIQMDRAFAGPALIFAFYNLVRNHGAWDYKQQNSYPQQYDDAGNFNYGATGAAAGLSTQLLLRAAGYAQIEAGTSTSAWRGLLGPFGTPPYGDDPADQAEIKAGIAYYNCLASGGQ
jgi:RHS repeat-associated protein